MVNGPNAILSERQRDRNSAAFVGARTPCERDCQVALWLFSRADETARSSAWARNTFLFCTASLCNMSHLRRIRIVSYLQLIVRWNRSDESSLSDSRALPSSSMQRQCNAVIATAQWRRVTKLKSFVSAIVKVVKSKSVVSRVIIVQHDSFRALLVMQRARVDIWCSTEVTRAFLITSWRSKNAYIV